LNEGATAPSDDIPHGSSSGVVQLADLQRILTGLGQTPGIVPLITEIFLYHCMLLEEYQTKVVVTLSSMNSFWQLYSLFLAVQIETVLLHSF
jgi:hypothetical protein